MCATLVKVANLITHLWYQYVKVIKVDSVTSQNVTLHHHHHHHHHRRKIWQNVNCKLSRKND